MPENNKIKPQSNKKRLGRGLGSLLSTDMHDFSKKEALGTQKKVNSQVQKPDVKPVVTAKEETVSSVVAEKQKAKIAAPSVVEVDPAMRIWNVAVEKVYPNKRQPRKDFDKESLMELSNSIREQGIIQPITVRKLEKGFEIIAGERRWRAAQLAGLSDVPVIIKNVEDQKVMELALIENIQRENLNPVEEAIAYQQLLDEYGLSQQELANKVGKERATVANTLRILSLPKEAKKAIRERRLSVGHAKVLLSVSVETRQKELLDWVLANKPSVRELEKEVRKNSNNNDNLSDLDVSGRLAQSLAMDLQKSLGTKVNISYKKGRGKIQISFYNDEELTNYCDKIKA